jgi:hypothetical protein
LLEHVQRRSIRIDTVNLAIFTLVTVIFSFTVWDTEFCPSELERNGICTFGVEDLYKLSQLEHLFANKITQEGDMGAYLCLHELIFNRTHLERGLHRLNSSAYLELPHVSFFVV